MRFRSAAHSHLSSALLLLAALPPASARPAEEDETAAVIAHRFASLFDASRDALGASALERRPILDRAARERALEIARRSKDERLQHRGLINEFLADSGFGRYQRVIEHAFVERYHPHPAEGAFESLEMSSDRWSFASGTDANGYGVGTARSSDGSLTLVVIAVEDLAPVDSLGELETSVTQLVNEIRLDNGLGPLYATTSLSEVAREHSLDMAARDFFAHIDPAGVTHADRVEAHALLYVRVAENIFATDAPGDIAALAVDQWMKSESHRMNILDPRYSQTGVGVARNEEGKYYFTQLFMLPREAPRMTD